MPFTFSAQLVVLLPATFIQKECPFHLEIFRHSGHCQTLLSLVHLRCRRETPKTDPNCTVSGRFWAFSFDISGFQQAGISFNCPLLKSAVCCFWGINLSICNTDFYSPNFHITKNTVFLRTYVLSHLGIPVRMYVAIPRKSCL